MTALKSDRQRLYGLVVDSVFGLHQNRPAAVSDLTDVTVSLGVARSATTAVPAGAPVIEYIDDGTRWYSAARGADGSILLRFHGAAEFEISSDLSQVVVHEIAGSTPGISTVLTTGGMLAFQLYLRGHTVLHGSAVQIDDRAIAFVGHSGQGKSTMAALQCADGARLMTDDVLRLDSVDEQPLARLGATELRLRKGADELAPLFDQERVARRISADDRQIISLPDDADDTVPLAGIVIPVPDRTGSALRVERLSPSDAAFALLNIGRLFGWADQQIVARHFRQVSQVVRSVPMIVAHVPWGPPFSPSIAAQIRDHVLGAAVR